MSLQNAMNFPNSFAGIYSWCHGGQGAEASQLISRVPTKVFKPVYCC